MHSGISREAASHGCDEEADMDEQLTEESDQPAASKPSSKILWQTFTDLLLKKHIQFGSCDP
jgi:hypothetical protein